MEDEVDRTSSDATFNLFSWYRNIEGGLWLEENPGKHECLIYDAQVNEYLKEEAEPKPFWVDARIRRWQENTALEITPATSSDDISLRQTTPEIP